MFEHLQPTLLLKIQQNSAEAQRYCTQTTRYQNPFHNAQINAHLISQSNWGQKTSDDTIHFHNQHTDWSTTEEVEFTCAAAFPKDKNPRLTASIPQD